MAEARTATSLKPTAAVAPLRVWRFFRRWPVIPLIVITGLILMAALAPVISTQSPYLNSLRDRNLPPIGVGEGSSRHLMGTDPIGRDVFSRFVHGSRMSLLVAAVALVTGSVVGTTLGLVAGYFGGVVDEIIMRIVDIWFSLPFLMVALLVTVIVRESGTSAVVGAGAPVVMALLALLVWAGYVRYVRVEVLSLKMRDYVALARVAGASTPRILLRHILPGVINTVLVIASLRSGQIILAEASLSFLGAGIPPPTPTWGSMVADGREYLQTAWWVSVFPGLGIFLLVMSLNFLGDWLRDRFDPRLRQL